MKMKPQDMNFPYTTYMKNACQKKKAKKEK